MTIQTIIKKAVKRLELEGKLLTPDSYVESFCKEAKNAGMAVEDCNHVNKFTASLNQELQKELTQYRIKSMSELVRFLISKLNRANPSKCSKELESYTIFVRRVLQVIEVLHNKEASELAKKSLEALSDNVDSAQIDHFRQLWINFIATYDDSFLDKLKKFGNVDNEDLKKSIQNLNIVAKSLEVDESGKNLSKIASYLISSFVPSISSNTNEKIADICKNIKNNPSILYDDSIEDKIKSAISLRISLDKKSLKDMVQSLDAVLDKLSLRLIDMIEKSDGSTFEIQKIKKELESYSEKSISNFKIAHKKLFTIALALEENTQVLNKDLKEHSSEIKSMSKKISQLENELLIARQESQEDFLTKLSNRRALDEYIAIKEAEFERYGLNFSFALFDLDHFKLVNDNYGHDAGDAVLSAFAKILKKESRRIDFVGRFGGEEFLVVLNKTDIAGAVVFAQKVRKHVQKARFMYKGERIKVTVSCGVSERAKQTSLQNTLTFADECLYKAKENGRNQVSYKR